ncbi:SRPBCC domain-containing protein [uncultured Psychroserpens sp.]|uniref:SRPBCC domain-containing protein n=1 Tax=uncultured Psychroserpens sp. TaxID=255436 RepID=UPI0026025FC9|nr:SRPBCC domain-containing protein [uncultured Psychroserpens sp.]
MRKVKVSVIIKTKPEVIINAFTELEMLNNWWGVERVLIDKKIGGVYILAWNISDQSIGFVTAGKIKEYRYGELLVIDNLVNLNPEKPFFGPMLLTIETKILENNLTELNLCQDGYQYGKDWDWYYRAVKKAWPEVLKNLQNYLEGL